MSLISQWKLTFDIYPIYYTLNFCRIGQWSTNLSQTSIETLVSSFISLRFDYCTSLFCNPSQFLYSVLIQCFQNQATRSSVLKRRKTDGVNQMFQELHWFSAQARIIYKIVVFFAVNIWVILLQFICQVWLKNMSHKKIPDLPISLLWLSDKKRTLNVLVINTLIIFLLSLGIPSPLNHDLVSGNKGSFKKHLKTYLRRKFLYN